MAAPDDGFSALVDELPATGTDADLGWRGRPTALAALGAAVLARTAFDPSNTELMEPLEMQLPARLTLGPPDDALAEPGELFEPESAGINRPGEGDENALRRRSSQPRRPRAMRRPSARAAAKRR